MPDAIVTGVGIARNHLRCENDHNHDANPLKITCSHTGLTLDLGAFSRNREESSTTGSVLG